MQEVIDLRKIMAKNWTKSDIGFKLENKAEAGPDVLKPRHWGSLRTRDLKVCD